MDRLNRDHLNMDDRFTLENRVLPEFKRWMTDYPFDSPLFKHGLDGVAKWGAEKDPDINRRYREWLRDRNERGGRAE